MTQRQCFGVWLLISLTGIVGYFVRVGLDSPDKGTRIICAFGILLWLVSTLTALVLNLLINLSSFLRRPCH